MLEWKMSEEAKTVHKELYDLSDPDDPRSDTLITVIIKTVFLIKSLQTKTRGGHNRFWKLYLTQTTCHQKSMPIYIIESWTETLTDTATDTEMELVNILVYILVF